MLGQPLGGAVLAGRGASSIGKTGYYFLNGLLRSTVTAALRAVFTYNAHDDAGNRDEEHEKERDSVETTLRAMPKTCVGADEAALDVGTDRQ
ncbi:hypothetical protein KM043_017859 [Ampulex compressa]|nr:hypothetical protein KM043_017859 [Ampulex compressa]